MNILKPCRRSIKTIFVATFASLILSIGAQSVYAGFQITSPKAGNNLIQNSTHTIMWTYEGVPNTATVRLLLIQGANWKNEPLKIIATPMPVTTSSYSWVVGHYNGGVASPGSDYRIWIEGYRSPGYAESGIFTISAPIKKIPERALEPSKALLPLRPLPRGFVISGPPEFQKYIKGGLQVISQNQVWWHYVIGSGAITSWRLVKGGTNTSIDISTGAVSEPISVYESAIRSYGTDLDRMYYGLAELMIHEASHRHGTPIEEPQDQAVATARKGICDIVRATRPEYIDFFRCNQ